MDIWPNQRHNPASPRTQTTNKLEQKVFKCINMAVEEAAVHNTSLDGDGLETLKSPVKGAAES